MSASARTSFSPRKGLTGKRPQRPRTTHHGRKSMMKWILAVAVTLAWTASASAADKVVLMLNWYVYGEHAPFYYGKAKGIYAAEGIDLEIQEGRGSAATTQAVAAKTADFGYVDVPTMMRAAIKGAPVITTGAGDGQTKLNAVINGQADLLLG